MKNERKRHFYSPQRKGLPLKNRTISHTIVCRSSPPAAFKSSSGRAYPLPERHRKLQSWTKLCARLFVVCVTFFCFFVLFCCDRAWSCVRKPASGGNFSLYFDVFFCFSLSCCRNRIELNQKKCPLIESCKNWRQLWRSHTSCESACECVRNKCVSLFGKPIRKKK